MPRTHSRIYRRKMCNRTLLWEIPTVCRLHHTFSIGFSDTQSLRAGYKFFRQQNPEFPIVNTNSFFGFKLWISLIQLGKDQILKMCTVTAASNNPMLYCAYYQRQDVLHSQMQTTNV
ncbi:hypothetical protein AB205_0095070 [Aquarana catesbeiana]|uniref:Uncharacterized protein n=1 Tax=Aquarana catesbeiana TaxID=8400 RepID=A0A2G9RV27_AQUCT|nr:hypothetical protein AB205_0095070 [Aquarana catesbeiana]